MGSHYIPVNSLKLDGVSIQPEVYCPANGFPDPAGEDFPEVLQNYPEPLAEACIIAGYIPDPSINPPTDPEWIKPGDPASGEIILICSDEGDGKIAFTASGAYTVEITDNSGVIYTQNKAAGTTFSYTFAYGTGVQATGYSTFGVRIFAQGGSTLTAFAVSTIIGNAVSNWKILEARINAPALTTLENMFYNITDIIAIRFYCNTNSATSLYRFAMNTFSLEFCSFMELNSVQSMDSAFQSSAIKYITFPTSMPEATILNNCFSGCNRIENVVFPGTMNKVSTATSAMSSCSVLKNVTLPTEMNLLSNVSNFFLYCAKLQSVVWPASMPELITVTGAHYNCSLLKTVTLPTSMNKASVFTNCFYGCTVLKKVEFAASMPALSSLEGVCYNCKALTEVTIPSDCTTITSMSISFKACYSLLSFTFPNSMPALTTLNATFLDCWSITSITMPNTIGNTCLSLQNTFNSCKSLVSLTMTPIMNGVQTAYQMASNNPLLENIVFPTEMNALTTLSSALNNSVNLKTITMPTALPALTDLSLFTSASTLESISTCTFGSSQVNCNQLLSIKAIATLDWPTLRVSKLYFYQNSPASANALQTLNIDWANSTFGGTSPQIYMTYLNWTDVQLNALFTALPTVTGKTIDVRNSTGYSTCNKAIATAKGWSVV